MGDQIDAFVSVAHYADHLLPIVEALPADRQGRLYATDPACRELQKQGVRCERGNAPDGTGPLLVGGSQDLPYSRRPKVLVQHGAGQTYAGVTGSAAASFAGGPGHEAADLFICPNETVAALERARYGKPAVAVGCPKLDAWAQAPKPANDPPVVAVTFHWPQWIKTDDGQMIPEAAWAFPEWREWVTELATVMPVLGHAHPRAARDLAPFWNSIGVEYVPRAVDLLARADVLIADNTSLLFEWAALDRPVIFLRGSDWTDTRHGLRFGDPLPGVQWRLDAVDHPALWPERFGAQYRIATHDRWREQRRQVTERVYGGPPGGASERAAAAVLAL